MILTNPITLPASKMINTMTALIGDMRFNDTLQPSEIVNDLVDMSRVGKVDYGKGIIYNFKYDTLPVKDLTETSTATTITKPAIGQETITIDNYKFVPISLNDIIAPDCVLNGNMLNTFFSFAMGLMEDTAQFYLFDQVNNLYQSWTPTQPTQTVKVKQIDTSTLTGAELNEALKWNATEIGRVMRKTFNNMKIKNKKFTDKTKYTDPNDGLEKDVVSALKGTDMKIVFNDKYYTEFLANAMATLYHSEKVGEMIPEGRQLVLPQDAMSSANENTIAWLSHKDKFALADFYSVVMSWRDPSTGYTNSFYHFAFGLGNFTTAPGVKFVADYGA